MVADGVTFLLKHRAIVHRTLLNANKDVLWGGFKIPALKTLENLENIQENVFSVVLIPDWKFLCRYFSGSAQKRKAILRFWNLPEVLFANVCLFFLRYRLAKQNSLLQQKQTPAIVFPVSFVRKQSKWRHFITVSGLPLRFLQASKRNTSYKISSRTSLLDRDRCPMYYL